jgi:hypothetical protein
MGSPDGMEGLGPWSGHSKMPSGVASLVGEEMSPAGFEPTAPRLGIWCSILLSYGDIRRFIAHSRALVTARKRRPVTLWPAG